MARALSMSSGLLLVAVKFELSSSDPRNEIVCTSNKIVNMPKLLTYSRVQIGQLCEFTAVM